MFEFLPQTEDQVITSYTEPDHEDNMQQGQDCISGDLLSLMDRSEDCWDVQSVDHHWLYANPHINRLVGLDESYDFTGRYATEPPSKVYRSASALDFMRQNTICLHENKKLSILNINENNYGERYCYHCEKMPLLDANQRSRAVVFHGRPVLETWQENTKDLMRLQRYLTGDETASLQIDTVKELTDTQSEVLFFLISRVEPKRIARYLGCSVSTVHNCIDRMRLKLDVVTTAQLLEKVIHMDWHKLIPKRLMGNKQLSMILDTSPA